MVGSVLCRQIEEGNGGQFSALPVLPGPHPFLGAPCTKLFYLFALPLCMPFFHHAWRQCGRVDNYEPLLALLHVILAALTFNLMWHPFPWNNNKQTGDMTGYVQNGRRPQSKKKKVARTSTRRSNTFSTAHHFRLNQVQLTGFRQFARPFHSRHSLDNNVKDGSILLI